MVMIYPQQTGRVLRRRARICEHELLENEFRTAERTFSARRAASLAFGRVVFIRWCSNNDVTRFLDGPGMGFGHRVKLSSAGIPKHEVPMGHCPRELAEGYTVLHDEFP
jgi:hypothetical protein